MDRPAPKRWITMMALAAATALVAACSGASEVDGDNASALNTAGRWQLPAAVATEGAKVRLTYDSAPKWTGTAACGSGLRVGGKKLGQYLVSNFDAVRSVGGFACRRNTADSSRMSVHGTGRALDVFIPLKAGQADNARGDQVANWLVVNAQRIGVQLIIWDKSIWRANGTNAGAYGGPHPHNDHIHVELTVEGGQANMPWFSTMSSADAGTTDDGATSDDDARSDASTPDARPDATADAGKDAAKDSSVPPPPDAGPPPTADAGAEADPPEEETTPEEGTTTEPPPSSGPPPDDGYDLPEGEEPEEEDALGESSSRRPSSSAEEDEIVANAGCSTAPSSNGVPVGLGAAGAVLALGLVARRRKRP